MGYIYKVTNTANGKIYIGQTSRTIRQRWKEHVRDALKRDESFLHIFHRAIKKYGADSFLVEQIEECDSAYLDERERYWIKYYNSHDNGYNSDFGGRSHKGHPIYQYSCDGTFLREFETLGDAEKFIGGKTIMMNNRYPDRPIHGYIWKRHKYDHLNVDYKSKEKQVHQYSLDGVYIATYSSLTNAAKAVRGRKTGTFIGAVCRGERDIAYGYRWSFKRVDILPPFKPYSRERKVVRISLDGLDKKVYKSIKEAADDNNAFTPNIIEACKRAYRKCKGYYWRYLDQLELTT